MIQFLSETAAVERKDFMIKNILFMALLLLTLVSIASAQVHSGYLPQRVYNSDDKRFSDFEAMLTDLNRSDVVFVGEQHDDMATHRYELAILEGLARRGRTVIVAMEMFERDTQKVLDSYLAGKISEEEFLKQSRPWGNYATDYRPIIEFAKAKGWRVIAGNVPRRYASQVSRGGLEVIDKLPADERAFVAKEVSDPKDDYFKKFSETMSGHQDASGDKKLAGEEAAMMQRFYQAQVVKDDTMAESIAMAYQNAPEPKPLIVHFNGAFHSDNHLGTASRTAKRLSKARIKVVSVVPTEDMEAIKGDDFRKRGDYVLFVFQHPKAAKKDQ